MGLPAFAVAIETVAADAPTSAKAKHGNLAPKSAARALPQRKPVARVRKVSITERDVRFRLSHAAIDLLMQRAQVVSEGAECAVNNQKRFLASTMITIDLARTADWIAEPSTVETATRVCTLMEADTHVARMVRGIASSYATRQPGYCGATTSSHLKFTTSGTKIHIDVDSESVRRAI